MHHRKMNMHINFQQNRVSKSVKICNQFQLEFRKITPFGHGLPPDGQSGRFSSQSAY